MKRGTALGLTLQKHLIYSLNMDVYHTTQVFKHISQSWMPQSHMPHFREREGFTSPNPGHPKAGGSKLEGWEGVWEGHLSSNIQLILTWDPLKNTRLE